MKRLFAICVAAAMLAGAPAAFAQDKPAADPVRIELSKKLMEAGGGQKAAEQMMSQVYGTLTGALSKSIPADRRSLFEAIQRDIQGEMVKLIPVMLDETVKVYAANLTEQELRDMLAFQSSESGRAIARKLPAIMQQVAQAEVPYLQAMLPRMMEKAVDHACDDAKCTPAERRQVVAAVNQALSGKAPS